MDSGLVKKTTNVLDIWSNFTQSISITTTPTPIALSSITIDGLPVGAIVRRAILMVKFRAIHEDSGSENYIDGAQTIQIQKSSGGSWIDAINIATGILICALSARDMGDVLIGQIDIKDQLAANNGDVDIQWLDATSIGDSLYIEDIQTGLKIWYDMP